MKCMVKKFGGGGAHITLPGKYIGKELEVVLPEEGIKVTDKVKPLFIIISIKYKLILIYS